MLVLTLLKRALPGIMNFVVVYATPLTLLELETKVHRKVRNHGWKRLLALSHLRHYAKQTLVGAFSVIVNLHLAFV